jgi:hypothetical protein
MKKSGGSSSRELLRFNSVCCSDRIKKNDEEVIMKRKDQVALLVVLTIAMCWGMSLFFEAEAQAQQKKVTALEGAEFDTAASLADNIKNFSGKDVFVHLRSGKTVQGYVKSVGNVLIHLEKLSGRDFYDALIRIEDISAIEVKFRDMK